MHYNHDKMLASDRTNREGEGEGDSKCNSAFSSCTCLVPSSAEGHAASGLFRTFVEHYHVLANLCNRLKRGFTY